MGPVLIIGIIVGIIIFVIGAVFFTGHGSEFLAGYNTATEAQRSMIDEKKMMRLSGIMFIILSILTIISFILYDYQIVGSWILIAVPLISVGVIVIVLNSRYIKKEVRK